MEYKTILILGGNSDLAKSLAKDLAKLGFNLILTSRKKGQLDSFKYDLEIKYSVKCEIEFLDILDFESHQVFYEKLSAKTDIVITCIGYLDNQNISQNNFNETLKSIQSNFTGLVSILNIIANDFENKKSGIIIGISSIAGDRGRSSNYIYGSAKSAFSTYLSGLRNRLYKNGVKVITVKPGFIRTKMTSHLELNNMLTASTENISKDIINAINKNKDIVYTRWFWKYIILIIKYIPERIFKSLNI